MKKYLACFLLIVVLFTTSFSTSHADHTHTWVVKPDNDYEYVYYSSTSTTHTFRVYEYYVCSDCGATSSALDSSFAPITESHQFTKRLRDAGHSGNGLHAYVYKCKVNACPREKTLLFECSGPPCPVTPINKKPIIVVDE